MNLPIDMAKGATTPRFHWTQVVTTPIGDQIVEHTGVLPPTVEVAVAELIALAKRQHTEIDRLKTELTKRGATPAVPAAQSVSVQQAGKRGK
jgi:hypothetical protein